MWNCSDTHCILIRVVSEREKWLDMLVLRINLEMFAISCKANNYELGIACMSSFIWLPYNTTTTVLFIQRTKLTHQIKIKTIKIVKTLMITLKVTVIYCYYANGIVYNKCGQRINSVSYCSNKTYFGGIIMFAEIMGKGIVLDKRNEIGTI